MRFDTSPPISLLPGSLLAGVTAREHDWSFQFDNGVQVVSEGHWRLVEGQRVVVTDEDHHQQFGVPAPMDSASIVQDKLAGAAVREVAFSDCWTCCYISRTAKA